MHFQVEHVVECLCDRFDEMDEEGPVVSKFGQIRTRPKAIDARVRQLDAGILKHSHDRSERVTRLIDGRSVGAWECLKNTVVYCDGSDIFAEDSRFNIAGAVETLRC